MPWARVAPIRLSPAKIRRSKRPCATEDIVRKKEVGCPFLKGMHLYLRREAGVSTIGQWCVPIVVHRESTIAPRVNHYCFGREAIVL